MSEQPVLVQKENGIAWITLNRPQALNGLNEPLSAALVEAIAQADADGAVRVMVLGGAGRAFCAGGDLKAIAALESEDAAKRFVVAAGAIISAIAGAQKPVIAMVNGVAAGAGFNLALACDLIVAAENARFIQSFSTVGLIPDCGGSLLLTRAVGPWR
ncbi:MAG: enoyl-CoA hydratase/isomerase family protein, partial [Oscillospiraceae bacterium]